ncbi:hypothetical protein DFH27DRAFT_594847 [Peziza echinospora]|nr:hypothetical protein DFH27DRAFT_594847 [Peziza echinospora]
MSSLLLSRFALSPPLSTHTHAPTALALAQHSTPFLAQKPKDTPETWLLYENLLYTFLRTQDDTSAKLCLQRLVDRFGAENERILALTALYDEATATSKPQLEALVKKYEAAITQDPTNTPIHKRLISLLTHLTQPTLAISHLTTLLSNNPTDAEAWAELSHLYFSLRLYPQAIFCLEEVLLIHPNAYNIFARLGEIAYIASTSATSSNTTTSSSSSDNTSSSLTASQIQSSPPPTIVDALRYYLRSIELCEDYLRGYYGLVLVTSRILALPKTPAGTSGYKVRRIQSLAVSKLLGIVGNYRRKTTGWLGYDEGEIEAAAALLEKIEGQQAPK